MNIFVYFIMLKVSLYLILAVVPGLVIVTPAVFPRFVLNHDFSLSAMMFINIYSLFIYGWRIFTILYTDNIIYFARLGDCFLFVCIQYTSKRLGPKFCVGPCMTTGKDAQNYKNLFLKVFDFSKILKIYEKITLGTLFCFCFILYKEKILTDWATVKGWNRRWARSTLNA